MLKTLYSLKNLISATKRCFFITIHRRCTEWNQIKKWCIERNWKNKYTKKSVHIRQEGNKEEVNCNFGKRKSKFESKDALRKKKLRVTNEWRDKQHKIDNMSKNKIREIPEGRKKQQEIDNISKKKSGKHLKKRKNNES